MGLRALLPVLRLLRRERVRPTIAKMTAEGPGGRLRLESEGRNMGTVAVPALPGGLDDVSSR